jgi:hypothetical protein
MTGAPFFSPESAVARDVSASSAAAPAGPKEYVLAALRCARIRVQLLANEVDEIGVALRYGIVTTDGALGWLREIGAEGFLVRPALEPDDAELK